MPESAARSQSVTRDASGIDLVQSYLDALLRDVGADPAATLVTAPEPEPVTLQMAAPEIARLQVPVQASAAQSPIQSEVRIPVQVQELTVAATVTLDEPVLLRDETQDIAEMDATEQALLSVQLDAKTVRVVPEWAQQGFAGLLFEVAGLKMAAPLHALGGISLIEDRLQPVVGQADWFMGLLRWNGRNLRVIDTARFVMPERLEGNAHHAAYQSVIVLGDSHWALAVDCADQSVHLKAGEIRWKQLMGTRPWLAGTVLQRLCALLDVDNLMLMLQQHEQQVRKHLGPETLN